jgi:hypothetical protein
VAAPRLDCRATPNAGECVDIGRVDEFQSPVRMELESGGAAHTPPELYHEIGKLMLLVDPPRNAGGNGKRFYGLLLA